MGNLQSVLEAFERIGASVQVTTRPEDIEAAEAVILPGVGAFGDGMANLHKCGLVEPIRKLALKQRKPLLGICVGLQLLADEGEEYGVHQGLGLIRGRVVRLEPGEEYRVPNMGWCDVNILRRGVLFDNVEDGEAFYFAHSYHLLCTDFEDVSATLSYGGELVAAVERDNIFGVQFHPEKSQEAGLNVLASFIEHIRQFSKIV